MSAPSNQEAPADIVALVAAQAAIRARLTAQLVALITTSARRFRGWYDTDAITAWSAKLARDSETLQRALAQNTDIYLARVLSAMTGDRVRPIGRVDISELRAGVTHAGAYARAADAYRWQQAQFDAIARSLLTENPKSPDLVTPAAAAVRRAVAVADMDAQLAVRAQEHATLTDAAEKGLVTGQRRVIHPELSKGGTCGLCVAASDRLYGPHELRPIHDRCECTTLPVIEGRDPGSALNRIDLKRLYKHAGGTDGTSLKKTRYQVSEHGELGPVLHAHGAKVRTARQAALDENRARRPKTDAEKTAQLRKIRDGLDPAVAKARELAASDAGQWGPYLKQLESRIHDIDRQLAAA